MQKAQLDDKKKQNMTNSDIVTLVLFSQRNFSNKLIFAQLKQKSLCLQTDEKYDRHLS